MAHDPGDFLGAVLADKRADEVQSTVDAGEHARSGQDAQAAEAEIGALEDALAASVAHLETDRTLASSRRAASSIRAFFDWAGGSRAAASLRHAALLAVLLFGEQVRVLVFILAQLEAEVVDDVAGVNNVGVIRHVTLRSLADDVLEFRHEVRVGGGGQAGQDARFAEEQRAGADAHQGALAGRVLLLQLGKAFDEVERLALALEDLVRATADDDQDVDLVQAVEGVGVAEVGLDGGALRASDELLLAGQDGTEGLGL